MQHRIMPDLLPEEIAMPRPILAESNIHPAIRDKIASTLVGGASDLVKLMDSGELKKMLA